MPIITSLCFVLCSTLISNSYYNPFNNSIADIRAGLGMGATIPTDATITIWQTLVDTVIDKDRTVDADSAAVVEFNRVSDILTHKFSALSIRYPQCYPQVWII